MRLCAMSFVVALITVDEGEGRADWETGMPQCNAPTDRRTFAPQCQYANPMQRLVSFEPASRFSRTTSTLSANDAAVSPV